MQNIKFPFAVQLAGDSIWGYMGPQTVTVTAIDVYTDEDDGYTSIEVEHNTTWDIYTDSGFESAISAALGYDVQFTEQGMQQDGVASLEC
jgi:beta-mannanase